MMVVPYTHKVENPQHKYLNELDLEMSNILTNQAISIDDRAKLYDQALRKFNSKFNQYGQPSSNNITTLESTHLQVVNNQDKPIIKNKVKKNTNKWIKKKIFLDSFYYKKVYHVIFFIILSFFYNS